MVLKSKTCTEEWGTLMKIQAPDKQNLIHLLKFIEITKLNFSNFYVPRAWNLFLQFPISMLLIYAASIKASQYWDCSQTMKLV